jgi:hypothetical protein
MDSINDTAGNGIDVPYFSAIPIITRQGENIIQETYIAIVSNIVGSGWPANFEFRLDLYTVDADSNNIYAASLRDIVINPTNAVDGQILLISVSTNANNTINFCIYDGSSYVSNFNRTNLNGLVASYVEVEDQLSSGSLYPVQVTFTRVQ